MKSIELQIENELKASSFITFRLDAELNDKLNSLARQRGATRSAFVRALLKFGVEAISKSK